MLNTGGPVLMPWLHHVEAVLQAWYPGQQFGAALASVLFGDSDPGGRLPVTFPAGDAQGPAPTTRPERYPGVNGEQRYDEGIFVGYRWYDQFRQQPLFPFGYGLSYADFRFGDLRVRRRSRRRDGDDARDQHQPAAPARPSRRPTCPSRGRPASRRASSRATRRSQLGPGRSAVVSFRLDRADLSYFDEGAHRQVVADGRYTLFVGSSSRDLPQSAELRAGPPRPL